MHSTKLALILKIAIHDLYHVYKHLVFDNYTFFARRFTEYRLKVLEKHDPEAYLPQRIWDVVGFLDGSRFEIAKPTGQQIPYDVTYNGKTKTHCVNTLAIVFPYWCFLGLFGKLFSLLTIYALSRVVYV